MGLCYRQSIVMNNVQKPQNVFVTKGETLHLIKWPLRRLIIFIMRTDGVEIREHFKLVRVYNGYDN